MERQISRDSSRQEKKNVSSMVFDALSEYLFDRVNFLNNPGLVTSNNTTSTTTYKTDLRVPDTSGGKYLQADRESRFRTVFYFAGDGASVADAYILSPCLFPASTGISAGVTSMSVFSHYIGIKVLRGVVYLVAKDQTGERLFKTSVVLDNQTTYKLEIRYNRTYADIFLDDVSLGSIDIDNSTMSDSLVTIYPVIGLVRSTTGGTVELTFENYQFIQPQ